MAVALAPYPSTPIDDLVERARTDPEAFGELYDRHFWDISRYIYRRVHDQAVAEDLTADVFFKALRGLPGYRDCGRPFVCWLYRIAANVVVDHTRNHQPLTAVDERTDLGASIDVLETIVRRDEARRVWQAVARFPQSQQVAMRLRFQDDLSLAEIAGMMGRSEAAVKLLIHRAVSRLRTELIHIEGSSRVTNQSLVTL